MASPESRLDPELLDGVIEEIVQPVAEPDVLDRLRSWFSDLMSNLWGWLKSATGGEDGWLEGLGDWVQSLFSGSSGIDPVSSTAIMNVVTWLSVAALLGLFAYALRWLWHAYRPLPAESNNALYERMRQQAAIPLSELSREQQPAAIFYQVCLGLAQNERVEILPHSTNRMLARDANLPAPAKGAFRALADAADQALFGGWQPDAAEVAELLSVREQIFVATDGRSTR